MNISAKNILCKPEIGRYDKDFYWKLLLVQCIRKKNFQ